MKATEDYLVELFQGIKDLDIYIDLSYSSASVINCTCRFETSSFHVILLMT